MITAEQRTVARPISFIKELAAAIREGRKTVTRRLKLHHQAGDILYLTETHWAFGYWKNVWKGNRTGWQFVCQLDDGISFTPVEGARVSMDKVNPGEGQWYKRNARFMPRKYARTFIRIVDVRVEALQDINDDDIVREGAYVAPRTQRIALSFVHMAVLGDYFLTHRAFFEALWDSLHQAPGTTWADNPSVARLEFELME
jgi:hypothetical protein